MKIRNEINQVYHSQLLQIEAEQLEISIKVSKIITKKEKKLLIVITRVQQYQNIKQYHIKIDYDGNISLRSTVKSSMNIDMLTTRNKNIMKFSRIKNKDLDT